MHPSERKTDAIEVCCVCGTRPNFMKVAALVRAMDPEPRLRPLLLHTGQHYDERLSRVMFEELGLPRPDVDLGVGSASHAVQTAEVMKRFEPVLLETRPDLVLVVGDVNSTVAASLVAAKLGVAVGHVEAGLRSFDRTMPEEVNRVVTDAVADLLFASERSGVENLRREGVAEERIFFVGNVMIDTLLRHRERAASSPIVGELGLEPGGYALLTLHRPANVDRPEKLARFADALAALQERLPVVFPAHPRTRRRLEEAGLLARLEALPRLRLLEPAGYLDFLKLMSEARLVLTDSGGIQEETTILGVPCLTLRDNTERPATLQAGLNRLAGSRPEALAGAVDEVLADPPRPGEPPEKWDGRAGERIVEVLVEWAGRGPKSSSTTRRKSPLST